MVAIKNSRFEIGDWIVHYYYGVGKVEDIVEKGLDGNEKIFYKVSTKEIDYWIPVEKENVDHIKPIRPKKDFNKALDILAEAPEPIAQHHKTRKKCIHERWLEGNLGSRAKLLRDLHGRLKLEKLSFSEKEMFEKVRRFFINEWIISDKSLTQEEARKKIREALLISVEKGRKIHSISNE
ncbi:MAG: CarD family transcriptional regulator [Candidatus Helarchaeota archaeon]